MINFDLKNVSAIADRLALRQFPGLVITVTGTNGKGSTVAALEAIYMAAGYRVATFTSPYFYSQVEQIRLQQQSVATEKFKQAISFIELNDKKNVLTEFESLTLAALLIFKQSIPDIIILEVGMGGQRDAVNVVDNDLAIITNVELDHMQWLGDTREQIAAEKAGIMRAGKPVIYGDDKPPQSIIDHAQKLNCDLYCLSAANADSYATIARKAVKLFQAKLPVSEQHIVNGLQTMHLPARMQIVNTKPQVILDVAHNPAAAKFIAAQLRQTQSHFRQTVAVFSMLKDKDITAVVAAMHEVIDHWYIAPLKTQRAACLKTLITALQAHDITQVTIEKAIYDCAQMALQEVSNNDRIIVFGSFYTVAESQLLAVSC